MGKSRRLKSVDGVMVRGSLITLKRRCGKPNCSCAGGDMHETPALSYSVKGKTRILTLRDGEIMAVRRSLANYKKAVAELKSRALSGIRLTTLNIMNARRRK